MMLSAEADYGALGPIVSGAGSLIAASAAIGLAWRGRARWEPSEEDISAGPQKVGGLVAAVLIAILWFQTNDPAPDRMLLPVTIALVVLCVVSLCVYSFLIAMQTYEREFVSGRKRSVEKQKVIGGFSLTRRARDLLAEREDLTIQDLFEGSAYDVDKVWTRSSRALAKSVFVVCYLGLTISGTVALASAAILIGQA